MNWADVTSKRAERAADLSQLHRDVARSTHRARVAAEQRADLLRERQEALRRHLFFIERRSLVTAPHAQQDDFKVLSLRAQLDACRILNGELVQRIEGLAVLLDDEPNTPAPVSDASPSVPLALAVERAFVAARMGRSASFNALQLMRGMDPGAARNQAPYTDKPSAGDTGALLVDNEKIREAMQQYAARNRDQCHTLREKVTALEQLLC